MANEQLKVNSKTTIEEFKRKHNLLVGETEDIKENADRLPQTTGQGGKVLQVKEDGSGYELNPIAGISHLYWHGVELFFEDLNTNLEFVIINNNDTIISKSNIESVLTALGKNVLINVDGVYNYDGITSNNCYAFYLNPNNTFEVVMAKNDGTGRIIKSFPSIADFVALLEYCTDRVNQLL